MQSYHSYKERHYARLQHLKDSEKFMRKIIFIIRINKV